MADDDVTSFFAQKKAKKGGKSKGIQSVDVLAKKLEKSVKVQEELDKEEEMFNQQQQQINPKITPTEGQLQTLEDSEWIETQEELGEVDLGAFKIREMDTHEEVSEDEEVNKENTEVHRTWKTDAERDKLPEVEEEPVVVIDKKTQVYVPKARLLASVTHSSGKTPDIKDSMQFPSLADAADIETELEKKKKFAQPVAPPPSAWQTQPTRPAWGVNRGTGGTPVATEDSTHSAAQVIHKEESTAEVIDKPTEDSTGPKKYVPPSMRSKQGMS